MADLAILAIEKLLELIANKDIENTFSNCGYEDQLVEFKHTISKVKTLLLEIDSKHDDNVSNDEQDYIIMLKNYVDEAKNLFDEFHTLAQLGHIGSVKGVRCCGKVRHFFSSKKHKLSQEAHRLFLRFEKIKFILHCTANDFERLHYRQKTSVWRQGRQTSPYVDVRNIIGREKDKDAVIDMLMAPNRDDDDDDDDEGSRVLAIVGDGGIGKTALAQLVYNDDKIENEFLSHRFWVCVSTMKSIASQLICDIDERTAFVVLDDDVCDDDDDENGNRFVLRLVLERVRQKGNKVLVTSRSEKLCNFIGSKRIYKLGGLSREDSQHLFEKTAFGGGESSEMVTMGKSIAQKCCGNPLAINVVGRFLNGQDIRKWEIVERSGLTDIGKVMGGVIVPVLKLSYYNLAPSLKNCFNYCAIYPKDYSIHKEHLIYQWIAHDYVVPFNDGQCVEDAAEEYFSILIERGFFQSTKTDEYGNVITVKLPDSMHIIAQEVTKGEISVGTSTRELDIYIRHVNISGDNVSVNTSLFGGNIYSCICSGRKENLVKLDKHTENLKALKVLDLSSSGYKSLPQTIDKLLLLRYLNLSHNHSLEMLPNSITKLCNLQTLVLRNCSNLREVPQDFSSLINLRNLDLYGCKKLNGMPLGILKLRNLRVLPYFMEINEISDEELTVLQQIFAKLKGKISVSHMRREYSTDMKPLAKLTINCGYAAEWVIHVGVLKKLELPPYFRELRLSRYNGETLPWPAISLPHNLLCVDITYCDTLKQIPLSRLPHLKSLKLVSLNSMEYMESELSDSSKDPNRAVSEFFPSLETLEVVDMEKWKGWWKGDFAGMRLRFPCLSRLRINGCPNLTSFSPCSNPENLPEIQFPMLRTLQIRRCPNLASNLVCPSLETLVLLESSEKLLLTGQVGKLREMAIDRVDHLNLLPPMNNCLNSLQISGEIDVESALERVKNCASSIRTLYLIFCKNLKRLPRLDHFNALEQLTLKGSSELSICEEKDEEPWESLPRSLRSVFCSSLPKMKILPKGIACLSSLQSLKLWDCEGITSLPEGFKDLNSLELLSIRLCPLLKERLEEPEEFPKIQHIPKFEIF